jgi:hypothetical protein
LSQRSSKVYLSFDHQLQRIDLLDKKVSKGEPLEQQLPKICNVIQLGHYFIRNVQQNIRSEALIFLLRREADLIFDHCRGNDILLWDASTTDSHAEVGGPALPHRPTQ